MSSLEALGTGAESGLERVALYLQDKHPTRNGIKYAQFAEKHEFDLAG